LTFRKEGANTARGNKLESRGEKQKKKKGKTATRGQKPAKTRARHEKKGVKV